MLIKLFSSVIGKNEVLAQSLQFIERDVNAFIHDKKVAQVTAAMLERNSQLVVLTTVVYTTDQDTEGQLRRLLNYSVNDLEFSVRTANILNNANIRLIGELCEKSESELLKYKGLGMKVLREIREKLNSLSPPLQLGGASTKLNWRNPTQ